MGFLRSVAARNPHRVLDLGGANGLRPVEPHRAGTEPVFAGLLGHHHVRAVHARLPGASAARPLFTTDAAGARTAAPEDGVTPWLNPRKTIRAKKPQLKSSANPATRDRLRVHET